MSVSGVSVVQYPAFVNIGNDLDTRLERAFVNLDINEMIKLLNAGANPNLKVNFNPQLLFSWLQDEAKTELIKDTLCRFLEINISQVSCVEDIYVHFQYWAEGGSGEKIFSQMPISNLAIFLSELDLVKTLIHNGTDLEIDIDDESIPLLTVSVASGNLEMSKLIYHETHQNPFMGWEAFIEQRDKIDKGIMPPEIFLSPAFTGILSEKIEFLSFFLEDCFDQIGDINGIRSQAVFYLLNLLLNSGDEELTNELPKYIQMFKDKGFDMELLPEDVRERILENNSSKENLEG